METDAVRRARSEAGSPTTTEGDFLTSEVIPQRTASEDGEVADPPSWWEQRPGSDQEALLLHCAAPVLQRLRRQLADMAVDIVLTDAEGTVLDGGVAHPASRLADEPDGQRPAEVPDEAPEDGRATGVGTAVRRCARTVGDLGSIPIHHPMTGEVLGLLDLHCWDRTDGPLLPVLARATAESIERELGIRGETRELALFEAYLRACRGSSGIVFALSEDVVMMNGHARQLLTPDDQSAMLGNAAAPLRGAKHASLVLHLPSGVQVRLVCTPVRTAGGSAGSVVRARITSDAKGAQPAAAHVALPGVVGSSPPWQRAAARLDGHCRGREPVIVEGERGVGRLALVRAVHRRNMPAAPLRVLDFADPAVTRELRARVRTELADFDGTLVLRHIDQLRPAALRALTTELRQVPDSADTHRPWVVATTTAPTEQPVAEGRLLETFPHSVEVPPLRRRLEDLPDLVPSLLVKLSSTGRLSCSPAAMQVLMRGTWPGNVAQLRQVLRQVIQHRRAGTIRPDDLPPECRSVARRVLNPLESLERDAIVQGLQDADGNKNAAARALGMSRATIYRKIRDYGIGLRD